MKNSLKIPLLMAIVTCVISISGSYAATNYAISATKIGYSDNSNLGADNVQAAIDGTCMNFSKKLEELKKSMYPVGSIYISTKLSTTTAVAAAIGGTWQAFGDGKVLRSSTGTSEQTGGSSDVTLTTANLPSHTHTVTATGTVSSTFKGTAVTSGNNSKTPTASFAGTKGTTSSDGGHTHWFSLVSSAGPAGSGWLYASLGSGTAYETTSSGEHTHSFTPSGTVTLSNTTHTHSVTAAGTVSSTFAGTAATTTATGSGTKFSTIDPYITVYMYKRTA